MQEHDFAETFVRIIIIFILILTIKELLKLFFLTNSLYMVGTCITRWIATESRKRTKMKKTEPVRIE